PANWLSAVSGNWTTPSLWSTNPAYPNNGSVTYAPQIAATGAAYTVSLTTSVTVDSLLLNSSTATLLVNGGMLNVGNLNIQSATLTMDNSPSSLVGATLSQGSGGTLNLAGTLNNLKLGSDIALQLSNTISISNGFNLNGHNLNIIVGPTFQMNDSTGFTGT